MRTRRGRSREVVIDGATVDRAIYAFFKSRAAMNETELRHKPQWNMVGEEYHYIVVNRRVAKIISSKETPIHQS